MIGGGRLGTVTMPSVMAWLRSTIRRLTSESYATTIRPDDAMARDDERDRIACQGIAHGPYGKGLADLGRDPGVRPNLAARDLERLHEHAPFELGQLCQVQSDLDRPVGAPPDPRIDDLLNEIGGALNVMHGAAER